MMLYIHVVLVMLINLSKHNQSNNVSHNYQRSLKQLIFNDDVYIKRGRCRSLIEQVVHDRNILIEQFCTLSINRRVGEITIRLPTNKKILILLFDKFAILKMLKTTIYLKIKTEAFQKIFHHQKAKFLILL